MTGTPHRATAEQWNRLQGRRLASDHVSAIIELRARVEALEAGATCPHVVSSDEGTSYCGLAEQQAAAAPPKPAHAGSLVEILSRIISGFDPTDDSDPFARAAIRAVAEWLRGQQVLGARAWAWHLEQEVER